MSAGDISSTMGGGNFEIWSPFFFQGAVLLTNLIDFQSIVNYVQNQVTQRGIWVGSQFYPGTSISSITVS
jgi:hypothetical protein